MEAEAVHGMHLSSVLELQNASPSSPASAGPGGVQANIMDTVYLQPAIFALQVALVEAWAMCSVTPDAVCGHSFGRLSCPRSPCTCQCSPHLVAGTSHFLFFSSFMCVSED